jgi:hypothetical protein
LSAQRPNNKLVIAKIEKDNQISFFKKKKKNRLFESHIKQLQQNLKNQEGSQNLKTSCRVRFLQKDSGSGPLR